MSSSNSKLRTKAYAIVHVFTDFGRHCLSEIDGLKEGMILRGYSVVSNDSFEFTWNGQDAVLWLGENASLYFPDTAN